MSLAADMAPGLTIGVSASAACAAACFCSAAVSRLVAPSRAISAAREVAALVLRALDRLLDVGQIPRGPRHLRIFQNLLIERRLAR